MSLQVASPVILDGFSRKLVGWQLDHTSAVRLPLTTLEQAIVKRTPGPGLVHHSDRGLQYLLPAAASTTAAGAASRTSIT